MSSANSTIRENCLALPGVFASHASLQRALIVNRRSVIASHLLSFNEPQHVFTIAGSSTVNASNFSFKFGLYSQSSMTSSSSFRSVLQPETFRSSTATMNAVEPFIKI